MKKFGNGVFFRLKLSPIRKIFFIFFGYDFIGAVTRFFHFQKSTKKIKNVLEKGNILDAGCGNADFSLFLAERYKTSTIEAIDIIEGSIKVNKEIAKKQRIDNISFFKKNLLNLNLKNKYDFVFSICVLIYFNHLENMNIFRNIHNSLKKGGYFYVYLPKSNLGEYNVLPITLYPKMRKQLLSENKGKLYAKKELETILKSIGFKIIDSHNGQGYFGMLSWEIDALLREHRFNRLVLILLPILRFFSYLDANVFNKTGSCISVLCQKI